jgi:aspartyl protease family protein
MNLPPLSFLFGSVATFAIGFSVALPAEGDARPPMGASANAMLLGNSGEAGARSPDSGTIFHRARDGLFYVTASVNGTDIRFLVDSGASVVVLSEVDAARAGLREEDMRAGPLLQTASGSAAMRWSKVNSLRVAGKSLSAIDAAVVGQGLNTSLLGQNALTQLGNVTISGDTLKIN